MPSNSTIAVVVILILVVGALVWWKKKSSATSSSSTSTSTSGAAKPSALDAAVADLKQHVEQTVSAGIASAKTRVATVGDLVVQRITGSAPSAATGTINAAAAAAEAQPAAKAQAASIPVAAAAPSAGAPPAPPAAAPTAAAQPGAAGDGTEPWPHLIVVDGVNIMAAAPINPAWKVTPNVAAFTNATHYLADPSNGGKCVPPQPIRSPAGYPLWYAIGAGNAPVGAAQVIYGGNEFPDDAAVAAYISTVATARTADDAAAALAASASFSGPVPVGVLGKADLEFLWWATANPMTPKLHNWEYQVLSGTGVAIREALATIGNNIAIMRNYDPTKYQGVLRAPYDAAVKAA